METQDIRELLKAAPAFSAEDGSASFWMGEPFNKGRTWVGRFSGQSPWERHPDGDELLYVLEGEVEITVLIQEGRNMRTIRAGSFFVVPQGLWHRQLSRGIAVQFGATPGRTEHSQAEDPSRPEQIQAAR